ncbi:TPA: hypothetical protein ACPY5B_000288 [Yersinia enterocolitica]|uniref:hypothetical protein n=1 Tax=Yersinia enterocolitica TaxID=630 RepID=UPI002A0B6662|nr:hypothetical protein [Yersinia enterocolitica]HDL7020183.1 hypothetical protein [Yersinia enterocolitica]
MPSKEPERIHHDWDAALVAHCDFCSHSKMTVPHADGGRICASCCDSEFLSNWQNYARSLATELLSLREQLAELKEWATNRAITDDARENENYTTLKIDYRQRQLRELLKTAKPAED